MAVDATGLLSFTTRFLLVGMNAGMGGFNFCLGLRGETTSLARGCCEVASLGAPDELLPVGCGCSGSTATLCTTLAPELAVGAVRPPLRPVPLTVLLATRPASVGLPSPALAFELVDACNDDVEVGRKNWRVLVTPAGFVVIVLVPGVRFFTSSAADLASPVAAPRAFCAPPEALEDATAFLGTSRCSVPPVVIVLGFTAAVLLAVLTGLDPTPIVAEFESTLPAAGLTAPCGLPKPNPVDVNPGRPSATCVNPETILALRAGPAAVVSPAGVPRCACDRRAAPSGAEACVITLGRVAEVVEAVSSDPSSSSSSATCPGSPKTLTADAERSIPVRAPDEDGVTADAERSRNGRIPFPDGAVLPDALSDEAVLPSPRIA